MCTCISFKTKDHYFGRSMDLEYHFNEQVVITPRDYEFQLKSGKNFRTKYAFIGCAAVINQYPLYAEATNEKGLSIAGLNFPENACYQDIQSEKINLAPYELIPWILGNFSSVEEVYPALEKLNLVDIAFGNDIPTTPLHFMVSDQELNLILEPMKDGLKVHFDQFGVLTNNPPFPYHVMNMNNFLNLTPDITDNRFSDKVNLSPYGLGMGAIGLPGDNSPSSRFVRATFNLLNSVSNDDEESSISQFFHILDTVFVVRGTTMTKDKRWNITTYSCCCNTTKGIYYYKTYYNNQITAVKLTDENMSKDQLSVYELQGNQQIKYLN